MNCCGLWAVYTARWRPNNPLSLGAWLLKSYERLLWFVYQPRTNHVEGYVYLFVVVPLNTIAAFFAGNYHPEIIKLKWHIRRWNLQSILTPLGWKRSSNIRISFLSLKRLWWIFQWEKAVELFNQFALQCKWKTVGNLIRLTYKLTSDTYIIFIVLVLIDSKNSERWELFSNEWLTRTLIKPGLWEGRGGEGRGAAPLISTQYSSSPNRSLGRPLPCPLISHQPYIFTHSFR